MFHQLKTRSRRATIDSSYHHIQLIESNFNVCERKARPFGRRDFKTKSAKPRLTRRPFPSGFARFINKTVLAERIASISSAVKLSHGL